jgi:hypothetical protein
LAALIDIGSSDLPSPARHAVRRCRGNRRRYFKYWWEKLALFQTIIDSRCPYDAHTNGALASFFVHLVEARVRSLLFVLLLLPTLTFAQTLVAKQPDDGSTWLLYVNTIKVGARLQNGDRVVSALIEKRDIRGETVHRARQYTTGCYVHEDGHTRWGYLSGTDGWTWSGPLILDIIATRSCQYAWNLVAPDAGISTNDPLVTAGQRQL